jgi:hypothetical protein
MTRATHLRTCATCSGYQPPNSKTPYHACKSRKASVSRITGERDYGLSCHVARAQGGRCGPDGRYWDERDRIGASHAKQ